MSTPTIDVDVAWALLMVGDSATQRRVVRAGEWSHALKPFARAVLSELAAERRKDELAGDSDMAVFVRRFLGRALAEDLLAPWQVPTLHDLLWDAYDDVKRTAGKADEEMRRRLDGADS